MITRTDRGNDTIRPLNFDLSFSHHAEGSCMISLGNTKVLNTITIQDGVPRFLSGQQQGWLTAEYSMLPRSTHTRCDRDASRSRPNGRTLEIQRLIGRSLRNTVDLSLLKDTTIIIDCDVIQADGGTRTAAINGAMVALISALRDAQYNKKLAQDPLRDMIAAISIGLHNEQLLLDLDYQEDSAIGADINVVMNRRGDLIEIQGSSEGQAIPSSRLPEIITLARKGIDEIFAQMQHCLDN